MRRQHTATRINGGRDGSIHACAEVKIRRHIVPLFVLPFPPRPHYPFPISLIGQQLCINLIGQHQFPALTCRGCCEDNKTG